MIDAESMAAMNPEDMYQGAIRYQMGCCDGLIYARLRMKLNSFCTDFEYYTCVTSGAHFSFSSTSSQIIYFPCITVLYKKD